MIAVKSLHFGYNGHQILQDINFSLGEGERLAVLGPNGSGKTTLIRCLAGILPYEGEVLIEGIHLKKLKRKQIAAKIAYLPQIMEFVSPISVEDFVRFGRYPHLGRFDPLSKEDHKKVAEAMDITGTSIFAKRLLQELSGGERQKVLVAKAIAQEPKLLILDEPNSFLDMYQQIEMTRLIHRYVRDHGITLISILHDLNLANSYHEKTLLMKAGRVLDFGRNGDVLTKNNLWTAFQLKAEFLEIPGRLEPFIYADLTI